MAIDKHLVMVNLNVNGRKYPLKIKVADEQFCRSSALLIEKKISQYRNKYSGADIRQLDEADYAIMTTIQAVMENEELANENKKFEDKIKSLTEELDQYLKKKVFDII